jgi:hypothetical protein
MSSGTTCRPRDEYYTSPTSYGPASGEKVEPWMPNVTALHDPANVKWKSRLTPGVAYPTPWAEGGVRGDGARDPGASASSCAPSAGRKRK